MYEQWRRFAVLASGALDDAVRVGDVYALVESVVDAVADRTAHHRPKRPPRRKAPDTYPASQSA